MKTKLRTMVLAAAGLLGSVSSVYAQAQGGQPPAPPPPGQPPPADFGVAPAALPPAPLGPAQPPPPVSFGNQPPPAAAPPPEEEKPWVAPNPFRLTRLSWNNNASAKIFGVGKDYISSDDESYSMDFVLNLRYFIWETRNDQLFINSALRASVEITNADNTVRQREVQLGDLPVVLSYLRKVYSNKKTGTSLQIGPRAGLIFPIGSASREQGQYLTTQAGAFSFFNLGLAGPEAKFFSSVFFYGFADWRHLFSRATQPTNGGTPTKILRNIAGAGPEFVDNLGNSAFTHDQIALNAGFFLSITEELSLNNAWGVTFPFKYKWSDSCVNVGVANEPCTNITSNNQFALNNAPTISFDVGLSYTFWDYVRLDIGYDNTGPQIAADGKRRSVFYNPEVALFYANATLYTDTFIDMLRKKISGKGGSGAGRLGKANTPQARFGM